MNIYALVKIYLKRASVAIISVFIMFGLAACDMEDEDGNRIVHHDKNAAHLLLSLAKAPYNLPHSRHHLAVIMVDGKKVKLPGWGKDKVVHVDVEKSHNINPEHIKFSHKGKRILCEAKDHHIRTGELKSGEVHKIRIKYRCSVRR